MEIVYRKLTDMKKLDGNPRKITQEQLDTLKQSIERNKDYFEARPLILSDRTGELVIIAGNQRYEACKQLGIEECPTVLLQGLTEEREKEIIIRDNVSNGEWDEELLQDWDSELLEDWGVDISGMECFEESEAQAEEDDFDESTDEVETVCKEGDLWKLGEHRLLCGDSTDEGSVALLMNGELADMVFTDPPYGVSYTDKNEYLNSLGAGHRLTKAIENDSMKPEDMYSFWVKAFSLLHKYSKDRMSYYITAPQGGDLLLLLQAVRESGFMLKHQLIWNKNNHVLGRCDYNYKHEPIIYGWKIGGTHEFYGDGKFKTSVWDIPKPLKNDLHPTMKPIELVSECLLNNTKESDFVLDLFGGSGTTLIACEQLKRKAFIMELDPHYCDVIIARWEKLTGKKAEKIN